ncbi:hypothetical protein S58_46810 [Bradyrhizobium oligotrophicum S58]|uniref:Uncharacterized protein n=1 Tax=Bradyrhizobium oligotrophicum S58 TaxID=1245469 RepID=M4ZAN1_9BRAD|nr:hypothetical protein S58_46810 [Bradyrhizobium oligotrophicum S58]
MRMIERRIGAHAHELMRADLDDGDAGIVVEMRDDVVGHRYHLGVATGAYMVSTTEQDGTRRMATPVENGATILSLKANS